MLPLIAAPMQIALNMALKRLLLMQESKAPNKPLCSCHGLLNSTFQRPIEPYNWERLHRLFLLKPKIDTKPQLIYRLIVLSKLNKITIHFRSVC